MPAKKWKALSATGVHRQKAPGLYADGHGLNLKVEDTGTKRWILRVTIAGRRTMMGLGGYPSVSLSEARERAGEIQRAIRLGRDPVAEKRNKIALLRKPAVPTFSAVAEEVIRLREPTWKSERHKAQWIQSLVKYVYPAIGLVPIDRVTVDQVLSILEPIWTTHHETAKRVRQRMSAAFERAVGIGWRHDNPAGPATLSLLVRVRDDPEHHPALHYKDVTGALQRVKECTANLETRLAFEFVVLTACRAGEVRGARWEEVDIQSRQWKIPGSRMKGRAEHKVPLATRALEVLNEARALDRWNNGLIFPNARSGEPLSNMAFSAMLKRLDIPAVPHGFRSSFRDWASEQIYAPEEVSERALAHNPQRKEVKAYARSDLFEPRQVLMDAWAAYATHGPPEDGWEDVRSALQVELAAILLATTYSNLGPAGGVRTG